MPTRPDFSALFTASPYPYLLIDTHFVIIGANPSYLHATGRTADDIVGRHIFDAFPSNEADPDSTNLGEVRVSIELAIATRKPHTSALLRYAVPRATPDGTVFDERYWSAVHTPVFDEAGDVAFVAQNAIDVTDLYRFDVPSRKYYLRQGADAVPDIPQLNPSRMHEAMTRILNAERSQMQVLFNQAPGFIAVLHGADHRFEMVNDAYYQLVGYRDIIGKPAQEALPETAGQGFRELLDHAFSSGEPVVQREARVSLQRQPGGALQDRYVDLLYQPIVGDDGRVTGIFVQGNDVTGAHEANRALQEKIQQLEDVRESQAFQLALADRMRQLANADDVTAAACELLGRKLDTSRVLYAEIDDDGGTAFIRRDWTADGIASVAGTTKILDDFGPDMIAALRAGTTVVNHDVLLDPRTAAHAHSYTAVGARANLLVPYVKAGKLQVVLTIQDAAPRVWQDRELRLVEEVAERTRSAVEAVQAEAALRTERDQSRTIFDSMDEGFAVLDRHWTILRMNAEGLRLSQRSADEVIGRNHWDVWPELRGTDTEQVYRRVMETGKTEIIEIAHTLRDGKAAWLEIRTHRSVDGGIAFFFRDVTERRAAQEQLTLADRRKDEFLAMLAHELRNPLAPIGAAAELLQVARLDEERVRQTSQIISRQVRHMTSLVDDLLDVSRVTRGLVQLQMQCLDIRHIVNDAIEQVTPLIRTRRHRLRLELASEAPWVSGDKKRLVQVLANLLNNAAKYTPEGGHIALHTEVRDGHVLIHVADDGIGMGPDLVARAFDLFSQAERAADRSLGGLGLGLALVKSLVGLHGGTVTCASPGLAQGSTFTVCLPRLAPDQATGAGTAAPVPPTGAAPARLRIMVVDDNTDAASMLAMLLGAIGHDVVVQHGAVAALAHEARARTDVFLLDIGLPDIDGNELARRLRADPATRDAVLVAITGYGREQDRVQTAAAGFDHHLVKPVDIKKLYAILAGIGPR